MAATNAPPKLTIENTPLKPEVKAATSYAPIIKKVAPSVVNISTTTTVKDRSYRRMFSEDPFFRRFFGEDAEGQNQGRSRNRREQSLGSGVIVSSDGYVLTASHVVEGADKVRVALATGEREFDARVVGADSMTDIAVLKVDASNLPALTIADSDKLEVGDSVLAVGDPFGVGQTVTLGIVSAMERGGLGIARYENFIQTDAAINPGNSGGALTDIQGRLVGINTAIVSRSGGYQGVGFAVPINLARYVMEQVTTNGKVTRGFLGLELQPDLSLDIVKQMSLPDLNGALVTSVSPGTPAAKAGIKDGDFIVEFNGKKVMDHRQFRLMVSQTAPKTEVKIRLLREGKEKILTASLGELKERVASTDPRSTPPARPHGESGTDALDGVEVTDLDSTARRHADIPEDIKGALVTSVDPDSNAAEAGLRSGTVIMEINRQSVRGADDAVAMSEKAKGERILLRIWRGSGDEGLTSYLSVDNTKHK